MLISKTIPMNFKMKIKR
uniref:Uncharacterized protein n=1 Tax=Anguilla anguilla TaxID=7936 RepID=A0A0E9T3Y7_ANGAN